MKLPHLDKNFSKGDKVLVRDSPERTWRKATYVSFNKTNIFYHHMVKLSDGTKMYFSYCKLATPTVTTVTPAQAGELVTAACNPYKERILSWLNTNEKAFTFTDEQIKEMRKAANTSQTKLLDKVFPETKKVHLIPLLCEVVKRMEPNCNLTTDYFVRSERRIHYTAKQSSSSPIILGLTKLMYNITANLFEGVKALPGHNGYWCTISITDEEKFIKSLQEYLKKY